MARSGSADTGRPNVKYTVRNISRGPLQIPHVEGLEGVVVLRPALDNPADGQRLDEFDVTADVAERLRDHPIARGFIQHRLMEISRGVMRLG